LPHTLTVARSKALPRTLAHALAHSLAHASLTVLHASAAAITQAQLIRNAIAIRVAGSVAYTIARSKAETVLHAGTAAITQAQLIRNAIAIRVAGSVAHTITWPKSMPLTSYDRNG